MILVIDNFDSFTYNLVQLLGRLKQEVVVRRNNEIAIEEIPALDPSGILISPGPGRPEDAGISVEVIRRLGSSIPIFGVCLGHQAIGYAFGGKIIHAPSLMHGRTSLINHQGVDLFENVPNPFVATRYHSLVISPEDFPPDLEVTATTDSDVIMGVRHKTMPITGVQFHPESILTESGEQVLGNWLRMKELMKQYIEKCLAGNDLTVAEAGQALDMIMSGQASEVQIAGLLIALRAKGESTAEMVGFARTMRERAIRIVVEDPDAMDIVGTGGDGAGTFNVSTVAAFVIAGSGITVAKHGNRSVSSQCGSADLLDELGINTRIQPSGVERCINETGIGFLFAPVFHPAMKHAAKARTELGIRTIFNILGPLTNPAGVNRQVIGAFNLEIAKKLGSALSQLNTQRAFVVHNLEGMDEVGLGKATVVHDIQGDAGVSEYNLFANDFGLPDVPLSSITGGTREENVHIALRVLEGEHGPHRSVVLANAALGIRVAGKSGNLRDAVAMAMEAIDSGRALQSLNKLKEKTNRS